MAELIPLNKLYPKIALAEWDRATEYKNKPAPQDIQDTDKPDSPTE